MFARKLLYFYIIIMLGLIFSFTSVITAQELKEAPFSGKKLDESGIFQGYLPIQVDLSHLKNARINDNLTLDLPIRFDWREHGMVTPVKNQGNCGSCYAFAFLSCFESKILMREGQSYDLSENNAKECNWYESSCDGGADWAMASYLNSFGTVLESSDPYVDSDVSCSGSAPKNKTLLEWNIISYDLAPPASILKYIIKSRGPIVSYMFAGDSNNPNWNQEFYDYDGSYTIHYQPSEAADVNHLVAIVGWDDTLSHDGGHGAWIVKNSWGNSWGGPCGYGTEGGYFTIAYNSALIGQYASYIGDYQDYDEYGQAYRHDEAGWNSSWGADGYLSTWGMCKYNIPEDCMLDRVEFWTNDENTGISIGIYDVFDGNVLSEMLANKSGLVFENPGLHSVQLDSAIRITANDNIFVAIKFTNTSNYFPVPADNLGPSQAYQSYLSLNGNAGSWLDLGSEYQSDVGIRIRCTNSALYLSAPDGNENISAGTSREITWSSLGDNIDNVKLEYTSNDGDDWYTIESSVPNNGSYDWIVPYTISNDCRVRISDAEDGVPSDESAGSFAIYCPVWPGDLDANGLVDAEDILPLAEYWYRTGPARSDVNFSWSGKDSSPWDDILITYADADGSGRVDISDFFPICINWNRSHGDALALKFQKRDYDIEGNREALMRLYDQVSDAETGAGLKIREYISKILGIQLPLIFELEDSYPNPFNSTTVIKYTLPEASGVNLSIYNIRGQLVNTLIDEYEQPGRYQVKWSGLNFDGETVASGVYFVKLQNENNTSVKTMSLIK